MLVADKKEKSYLLLFLTMHPIKSCEFCQNKTKFINDYWGRRRKHTCLLYSFEAFVHFCLVPLVKVKNLGRIKPVIANL